MPQTTLAFAAERIEHWPLSRLRPCARTAQPHGPDQVAKRAARMAAFGWTIPCLVGNEGELIAGHGRVPAGTQLGLGEAPVILSGDLTAAQRRACRIADGQPAESPWDATLLSAEPQGPPAGDVDLSPIGLSDGARDELLSCVAEDDGEGGGAAARIPPVTTPSRRAIRPRPQAIRRPSETTGRSAATARTAITWPGIGRDGRVLRGLHVWGLVGGVGLGADGGKMQR